MAGSDEREEAKAKEFLLYAGGVAAVLLALALVVFALRSSGNEEDGSNSAPGSTTSSASTTPESEGSTTTSTEAAQALPTDRVAYITEDGRVLSGIGAEPPAQVADGAALGPHGQGSMAISPTGDLIAFVRSDGAVVSVPVAGGEARILATDASLDSVGVRAFLSWDPTSGKLAYLAVGTAEMVAPRPETPEQPSSPGAYSAPLPEGQLGSVVKIVDRNGEVVNRLGDPSTRSMVGVTYSATDDLIILESTVPGEKQPYTLATASSAEPEVKATILSADDPKFSPDGSFILVVGPRRGEQELLRLSTENFSRAVLTSSSRICSPVVSPDSTRIVYGAGKDCSKLMLISSRGGKPVDITPPKRPDGTFAAGSLQWTAEGHFVVYPDCRTKGDSTTCSGPVSFFDPDRSVLIEGADASTVATVAHSLIEDLTVHLSMAGPIVYEGGFPVDTASEAQLTDVSKTGSLVDVTLKDGNRSLVIKLNVDASRQFSSGSMRLVDPDAGINRSFLITGSASLIGMRVASLSGIWISTADLPFASGEFRLSVVRGDR